MKIMHIDASARLEGSASRALSNRLDTVRAQAEARVDQLAAAWAA